MAINRPGVQWTYSRVQNQKESILQLRCLSHQQKKGNQLRKKAAQSDQPLQNDLDNNNNNNNNNNNKNRLEKITPASKSIFGNTAYPLPKYAGQGPIPSAKEVLNRWYDHTGPVRFAKYYDSRY